MLDRATTSGTAADQPHDCVAPDRAGRRPGLQVGEGMSASEMRYNRLPDSSHFGKLAGPNGAPIEELELFDRIKRAINNKFVYAEFLKCLNLFSHEIITKYGRTGGRTRARARKGGWAAPARTR